MFLRYKTLTIIWMVVIMGLTFTPGPNLPTLPHWDIISFDTFVHACIFAMLVFLMANTFKRQPSSYLTKSPIFFAIIISTLYGYLIEVIQQFIPGRNFDYYDILSDFVGCAIGAMAQFIQVFLKGMKRTL